MTKSNEIMSISRHRMASDGEGITTLVAFHGCPLNCKYCINSHCKRMKTPRLYMPPYELVQLVSIDDIYFKSTGGGVTFGGGEPLCASEYVKQFCIEADPAWKIRIETSLYEQWESVEQLIPFIDKWYVDIKETDPTIYKAYTGKENVIVLENLKKLSRLAGKEKIVIRVSLIPEFNDFNNVQSSVNILRKYAGEIDTFEYVVV